METNIRTKGQLEEAITALEHRKETEADEIKAYFHDAYQSLRPVNILKNTLSELEHNTKLRHDLIKTAIALAIGYLVKRLFTTVMTNPVGGTLGALASAGLSGYILKNPQQLKRIALHFLRLLFRNRLQQREQLRLQESV